MVPNSHNRSRKGTEHGRYVEEGIITPTAQFGIWQLTAAFHFPSFLRSGLCEGKLQGTRSAEITRSARQNAGPDKNQRGIFERAATVEARLRAAFCTDAAETLIPICSEPSTVEQLAPTIRRQTVTLLADGPFDWLTPNVRTTFNFRNIANDSFFNDFLFQSNSPPQQEHSDALNTSRLNVAAMIADRRSHMLGQGLAERTYNVFWPAGVVSDVANPARCYIVVPFFSFIRLSNTNCFRRTTSLSLVLLPISRVDCKSRSLEPDEPVSLQSGWTLNAEPNTGQYALFPGDLQNLLIKRTSPKDRAGQQLLSLRELFEAIFAAMVLGSVQKEENSVASLEQRVHELVVRAVQASVCAGYCAVIPHLTVAELRQWQANPVHEQTIAKKLHHEFANVLGSTVMHEWAIADPLAFRLDHGRGAEPLIPTFYFSFGPQRLIYTPSASDLESQNTSIFWMAGWHLLLMTGISALLEMLGTFHHEMEHRPTVSSAQAFLKEFLVDIEEYFDFDLLPVYRLDFNALKRVEEIDRDFERLRERVTALGQERIINEGRTTNRWLLIIALLSLLVSVAVLILTFRPSDTLTAHPETKKSISEPHNPQPLPLTNQMEPPSVKRPILQLKPDKKVTSK